EYVRVYRVGRDANPGEGDVSNDKVRHDKKRVNYVAFSHDRGPRPRLASVGEDGTVRLWNVGDTGTDAARFPPASAPSPPRPPPATPPRARPRPPSARRPRRRERPSQCRRARTILGPPAAA